MEIKNFDITCINDMVTIKTDDFFYSTDDYGGGCQANSYKKEKELKEKYKQVAKLIKEINDNKLSNRKKVK